jgi:DNA-binding SARP family transcriptional activator
VTAYQAAYKAMDAKTEYRTLVEAKLTSLGAAPAPETAAITAVTSSGAAK